jgi:NAD dependent epimerase/dehydratase
MKNSNVLITGADGFIGSHLTELLVREGCQVRALSQYNSFNNWGWLDSLTCLDDIEVFTGDIRDPHYCKKITKDIDIVFHLAALIAIPYSYIAPSSYVSTNIAGTLNICQAALENNCSRVIHTSTSEVYGTAQYVPIDETHPLQPQSPYSASKIGADMMALSFFNSFDLPVSVARPFNTYGPRQSARAVIPTIITQIAAGKKKIVLGDTTPTRDFIYVEDTCMGFREIAKCKDAIGEVINLGTNSEISVGETLNLIKELMGADVKFATDTKRFRPKKSEVKRLWCDNSKMSEILEFCPAHTLREGLKKTINWFTEPDNLSSYKIDIYNL